MHDSIFRPLLLLVFVVVFANVRADEKSLADMEREAKAVLADPDNVAQRKKIGPVFTFADRCAATGKTNEAVKS